MRREVDAIDDISPVGRQPTAITDLCRFRAGLCELPGEAAHFDDRTGGSVSQNNGHLQQHAKGVADVVRVKLREALGAMAALQEKRAPLGDFRESAGEISRFPGEDQRWIARQLSLDTRPVGGVRVIRRLARTKSAPPVG